MKMPKAMFELNPTHATLSPRVEEVSLAGFLVPVRSLASLSTPSPWQRRKVQKVQHD
jgi:hypothetical protein